MLPTALTISCQVVNGLRQDRENWLRQRMPTRLILEMSGSESEASERLKQLAGRRQAELVGSW